MNSQKQKPRQYKRITPATVAKHNAAMAIVGNGSAAVRELHPEYRQPGNRAHQIQKKSKEQNALDYVDESLQQIAVTAIQRVNEMVQSTDERIATKNSHYVIDQLRGKALQRTESKHLSLNIQSVLD